MSLFRLLAATWCSLIGVFALGILFPINAAATTVIPPSMADLVRESDYVVRAVVTSITTKEKTNPGQRPLIFSSVTLEVKEVILGTPPDPCVLEVLGGEYQGREMHISGAPEFAVGEEGIFFVQGNRTQIFPLTRMMHGVYPILKDTASNRDYVARSNGEPMTNVQQVGAPMHRDKSSMAARSAAEAEAISPDSFAAQIRATAQSLQRDEK